MHGAKRFVPMVLKTIALEFYRPGGDRSLHIKLYDAIASTVKHGFSQAKNSGTSGGEGLDA